MHVKSRRIDVSKIPTELFINSMGIVDGFSIRRVDLVRCGKEEVGDKECLCTDSPLMLVRGLPGTGKTTLAKAIARAGLRHFETDMFFERSGGYCFNPRKLKEAHAWCLQLARRSIKLGSKVVVANTFSKTSDLLPYLDLVKYAVVIETDGSWTSIHGVSEAAIKKTASSWQSFSVST